MATRLLNLTHPPSLQEGRMVMAFTGWMDGGDVATGCVRWLIDHIGARKIGEITGGDFYIYNFPGTMELAAMFRPPVKIKKGLVRAFAMPTTPIYCSKEHNLVMLFGREPNLNWPRFGRCVFDLAKKVGVTRTYFVGTFAGAAPHTREPRLYACVSDAGLRPPLEKLGVRMTDYVGPASFASFLMHQASKRGRSMTSLVAEIPAYVQGTNLLSIEAMTRRLTRLLEVKIDLSEMRQASNEWESRVTAAVAKDKNLAKQVRRLEERYDDELIDEQPSGEAKLE